jgi:hypothetical protein
MNRLWVLLTGAAIASAAVAIILALTIRTPPDDDEPDYGGGI